MSALAGRREATAEIHHMIHAPTVNEAYKSTEQIPRPLHVQPATRGRNSSSVQSRRSSTTRVGPRLVGFPPEEPAAVSLPASPDIDRAQEQVSQVMEAAQRLKDPKKLLLAMDTILTAPLEQLTMDWFVERSKPMFESKPAPHFQSYQFDRELGGTGKRFKEVDGDDGHKSDALSLGNTLPDYAELRKSFDGSEPFMRGHQISLIREVERDWDTPQWMMNDRLVERFLQLRFPNRNTDEVQERVGRWRAVIWLYYRSGCPAGEREKQSGIDEEMGWPPGTAASIVLQISRTLRGQQANGKQKTGRPRGRPKKQLQLVDSRGVTPESMAA